MAGWYDSAGGNGNPSIVLPFFGVEPHTIQRGWTGPYANGVLLQRTGLWQGATTIVDSASAATTDSIGVGFQQDTSTSTDGNGSDGDPDPTIEEAIRNIVNDKDSPFVISGA